MTESTRPKHVVIVDTENPMEEIHGEFFWREDHERLLADARAAAFRDGYGRGWADRGQHPLPTRSSMVLRIVRRPRHLVLRALALLVVVAYAVTLIGSIAH
jgi:hypothetical protein